MKFSILGKKAASSSSGSGPDETKRCLNEIDMGFERLLSMASEVDKRRKSAENSPKQTGSPRKGASELRLNDASFDSSSLAAKFKAGLMQGGGPGPSQEKPSHSGPAYPGGNMPEHHFKKRYFNEEYQRQQQKETEDRERHHDQARDRHYDRERQYEQQRQHRPDQMYDRSMGQVRGPRPRPGYNYEDRSRGYNPEDRGRGGSGGFGPPGPPRQMPPERFRHGAPPPPPGKYTNIWKYVKLSS